MKKDTWDFDFIKYAIAAFILSVALMCMLFGCKVTEDLQRSRAEKYYRTHPDEFSRQCADKYPPQVIPGETIYIKADTDSLQEAIINTAQDWIQRTQEQTYEDTSAAGRHYRSIIQEAHNIINQLQKHKCKPDTIRDTKYLADTKMLAENEALRREKESIENELKQTAQQAIDWKLKARKRNWILIVMSAVAGLAGLGWLVGKFKIINIKK